MTSNSQDQNFTDHGFLKNIRMFLYKRRVVYKCDLSAPSGRRPNAADDVTDGTAQRHGSDSAHG